MVAPHFFSGTKGSNMHALLIENYKVVCVVVQEESRALWLPELKALVPKDNWFMIFLRDINAENIVNVRVNVFESHYQLLVASFLIVKHVHRGIANAQFVLPFDKESFLVWRLRVDFQDEESEFLIQHITYDVEVLVDIVVADRGDFIYIDILHDFVLLFLAIKIKDTTVFWWWKEEHILFLV